MIINCRCGTALEVDEDMVGEEIQCPRCLTTMVAPAPTAVQPSRPNQLPGAAPQPPPRWFPPQPGGPASAPQTPTPGLTSANAMACMNLGVNSFTVPFVLAIPSFFFGILALRDCRKYRMQGKAVALTGMSLSVVSTVCMSIVIYYAYPVIKQALGMYQNGIAGLNGNMAGLNGAQQLGGNNKGGGGMDGVGALTADPKAKAESIAKALQSYQKEKGEFPSPNLVSGQPAGLSWRVGLVPYLNDALYPADVQKRIDFDKAWNHSTNSILEQKMPLAFMSGLDETRPPPPGGTVFQYFTGPRTLFPDRNKGVPLKDVPENRRSTTILFAESGGFVPWQVPSDMALNPGDSLPLPPRKFVAGFVDGSVRQIDRSKIDDQLLRRMIDPRSGPLTLPAN